jgi:hypothetical protein
VIEKKKKLPLMNIYNLAYDEQVELNKYIEKSQKSGIITLSVSLVGPPIFFVKKKNGE